MTLYRLGYRLYAHGYASIIVTKPDGSTAEVLGHLREDMKAADLDRIIAAAGKPYREDDARGALGYRPAGMETR